MKKILITISLLMLMIQQVVAAVNPLLDPSKKSSTIVDIGYNHEKMPVSTTIPKTLIDIPALSREIDKNLLLKDRIIDKKDCLTDDHGFETCPTEMETCNGNLIPNPGTATPHSGHVEVSAINNGFLISDTVTLCTDHYVGAFFVHIPSEKLIQVLYLGGAPNNLLGNNCGGAKYKSARYNNINLAVNGSFSVTVNSFGGGCSTYAGTKVLSNIPVSSRSLSDSELFNLAISKGVVDSSGNYMSSVDTTYYDYNIALCAASGAQNPQLNISSTNVSYECPNTNYTLVNTDRCKIDYTYYTYSCPSTTGENNSNITWADANPGGSWAGPFQAGGDCLAIGIADGGSCNLSTPPSDNCVRTSYTCPTDPTKDCAKIADSGALGTNIFSGYQYAAGAATQHSNTLTSSFICDNNGVYDSAKKACVIGKEYVCLQPGYTYSSTAGECIADAVCNDYWNATTNKCESAPIVNCQPGFQYNTRTMNCEKKLDCAVGTLNSSSGLCEAEPYCNNEPGYSYDLTTMKCYKSIDYANLLYQPVKPNLTDYRNKDAIVVPSTAYGFSTYDPGSATFGGTTGAYKVNVGVLNYRFYAAADGYYSFTYQVDDAGTVVIDGATIINASGWSSVFTATKFLTLGEHTIQLTGHDIYGGPRGQSLIIKDPSGNMIWNTRAGQPLVNTTTFQCPANYVPNGTVGNCKRDYCDPSPQYKLINSMCYFDTTAYSICPSGYTYDATYNVCYISTGRENLALGSYVKDSTCQGGGTINLDKRICETNPTCFNGTMDTTNKVCKTNETNTCLAPTTAVNGLDYSDCAASLNCSSNPYSSSCLICSVPRISGYDTLCANSNLCSSGGTQVTIDGIVKCKSTKSIDCPKGFVVDPNDSNKCLGDAKCPTGYVSTRTGCQLTYNWSTYTCDSGWQGPVEPGADCGGSCSEDGCWCNMENAPANNCKKLATISTGGTFTTVEKRDLERHIIRGTSFSPEDLGEFRNMECGADCSYYINKITGNGSSICFEKKNGEKKCLPVDDCYFTGEISPNPASPNDFIKSLSLVDQHTLRSNYSLPYSGSCAAGYMLDYNTMTCTKTITSTCRMNGHAGWTGRANGISSLGAGGLKTTVAIVQANGSASYDTGNNWQGFNIATMAVKLSDGYWYLVDSVKDSTGAEVSRGSIPSSIKLLNKAYYQIIDSTNTLPCKVGGVQVNGYCGTNVKITLPGNKMQILGFSDLESLNGLTAVTDNNTFNLNVTIGSNSFSYQGVKKMPIKDLTGLPNLVIEPKYDSFLSNKIDFWDSFVDKDIGFLEFIREVKNEDRADNFVPENVIPYNMLSKGFTVNDYISEANQVLFVKPTATTSTECNTFAAQIGGAIVTTSSFAANTTSFALSRGVGEIGSCSVLTTDVSKAFDFVNFAVRKNIYSGGFNYKCSPYTCLNHECATASCPTETIGGTNMQNGVVTNAQTVTYMGNILPDMLMPTDPAVCIDQICDAKAGDYVRQCGREIGCENRANVTFDSTTNKCLESYCDNGGVLNTSTRSCQVFKCPYGTVENAAGACIKP